MSKWLILESPDGKERYHGESAEGREDWTLVSETSRSPDSVTDDEIFDASSKRFKVDPERQRKRERRAALADLDALAALLEEHGAKIAVLESRVSELTDEVARLTSNTHRSEP